MWLCTKYSRLEVLLGDECEVINYCIFRGLALDDARRLAQRRADEIGRMFQRASRAAKFPICTTAESKCVMVRDKLFDETHATLGRAYAKRGVFWHDVRRQVRMNLFLRARRLPPGFISSHMDDLAMYVVRELALFYTLRAQELVPTLVELYPGPQLFVKERLFAGEYSREIDVAPLWYCPAFLNVAFLMPVQRAREPIPAADDLYSVDGDARPNETVEKVYL